VTRGENLCLLRSLDNGRFRELLERRSLVPLILPSRSSKSDEKLKKLSRSLPRHDDEAESLRLEKDVPMLAALRNDVPSFETAFQSLTARG